MSQCWWQKRQEAGVGVSIASRARDGLGALPSGRAREESAGMHASRPAAFALEEELELGNLSLTEDEKQISSHLVVR